MFERSHGNTNRSVPNRILMTQRDWNELHDSLVLALDALGTGPWEVDHDFTSDCLAQYQSILWRAKRRRESRNLLIFTQN